MAGKQHHFVSKKAYQEFSEKRPTNQTLCEIVINVVCKHKCISISACKIFESYLLLKFGAVCHKALDEVHETNHKYSNYND